jgi:hypothetical protein
MMRVGSDEKRLSRTIVGIATIEATSSLAPDDLDLSSLPAALVPSAPDSPHSAYEKLELRDASRPQSRACHAGSSAWSCSTSAVTRP